MLPTLQPGDNLLVKKNYYLKNKINRGDLVIFTSVNDGDYVKRIIGLPGDIIWMKDGKLSINKKEIEQIQDGKFTYVKNDLQKNYDIFIEKLSKERVYKVLNIDKFQDVDQIDALIVPNDHYYLLGDNRDESFDSRFIGTIPSSKILHKVFIIYWSSLDKSRLGTFPHLIIN